MRERDEKRLNRMTALGALAFAVVVAVAHVTDAPIRDDAEQVAPRGVRLSEVAGEAAGIDWKRIARRNGRRFAACHADLVRAQDRLRRLGHVYRDGRWIRTGGDR